MHSVNVSSQQLASIVTVLTNKKLSFLHLFTLSYSTIVLYIIRLGDFNPKILLQNQLTIKTFGNEAHGQELQSTRP